jgi:hypothetical protein
MIQFLLRPLCGFSLLIGLLLAGCSGQPEKPAASVAPAPSPALAPEVSGKVRQRLAELNQRVTRIDARIADLHEEQLKRLEALTSETEALVDDIEALDRQLGVKPPALAARPAVPTAGKVLGKATPLPAPSVAEPAPSKGPLGPLGRLLLIIIALFAIWIMARIFLGRLGEEEEDDEEFTVDSADEDSGVDEGPVRRLDPEVRAPVDKPGETPRGGAENERDEPRP